MFVSMNKGFGEGGIHPKDLDFSKEILFSWRPEFSQWHAAWCNPNIQPPLQVDTTTMLMYFLESDLWTVLPVSLVRSLKARYPIHSLAIQEGPPSLVCYKLVHRFPKPGQQHVIAIFEEWLEQFLGENNLFAQEK